ncbi:MAG: hypothetical protein H7138_15810 [Myxococcales bacterium]|nr:hypothetical protein [Myxococcales bacterium]
MRNTIWISMLSAAVLSTAACKTKEDSGEAMDKAATTAQKAQEDMRDQNKDIRDEQKDVANEQKDVAKEQQDVAKQQGELNAAGTELAQARERYNVAASQRLTNLDTKIRQIESGTTATAKDTAAKLRVRRDEIATRLGTSSTTVQADWDRYKKDVDDSFDKLEKDVDDALK